MDPKTACHHCDAPLDADNDDTVQGKPVCRPCAIAYYGADAFMDDDGLVG